MPLISRTLTDKIAADFNRVAELYDDIQAPLSDLVSQRLVELAKVTPAQSVLDIGTGTGAAALAAARVVGSRGSVTGVDISKGMMAIARRKASSQGLLNLRFEETNAASLGFAGGSFDVVISNLGIPTYLFRDTILEIFRVLKPEGTLCFAELVRLSPAWSSLSTVLARYTVKKASPALSARRKARELMMKEASKFPLSSFTNVLNSTGFVKVRTFHHTFSVAQPPSGTYLRYLITREYLEYSAMSEGSKRRFGEEMLRRLEAMHMKSSGQLKRYVKFWVAEKPVA